MINEKLKKNKKIKKQEDVRNGVKKVVIKKNFSKTKDSTAGIR